MSQGGSQDGSNTKVCLPSIYGFCAHSVQSYSKDTLRPITIKQALEADQAYPDADLTIDGQSVTQVCIRS